MSEQAVLFGKDRSLVGIVTDPAALARPNDCPQVILLNSGIVHRVGPNRMYVKIARRLASLGFVAMRFDFSGIGDSAPRRDNLPFVNSAVSEVQEAMDFLTHTRVARKFILIGGCSGARIAFQAAGQDSRIVGAFLINHITFLPDAKAQSNSESAIRASASYYWRFAFVSPESWIRFFTGKADYGRIARALRLQFKRRFTREELAPETVEFRAKLRELARRRVRMRFVWSAGDSGVTELSGIQDLASTGIDWQLIPKTDHTFSSLHDQMHLLNALDDWVRPWRAPIVQRDPNAIKNDIEVDRQLTAAPF